MKESFSKKAVGERLKGFRLSMHMTQKEFAEEMHWDVNTYRKIETGCSLLTSDKAQMLYDKYEIDITYLLTGNKLILTIICGSFGLRQVVWRKNLFLPALFLMLKKCCRRICDAKKGTYFGGYGNHKNCIEAYCGIM